MKDHILTKSQWGRAVKYTFFDWVNSVPVGWACATFTGRILPATLKKSEVKMMGQNLISGMHLGKTFSKSQIGLGFEMCMHQLNIKFIPNKERRRGRSLYCVPFEGGNPSQGVMNHIHALIEIPASVKFDDYASYLNRIASKKMDSVCSSYGRNRIVTDVWCQPYIKLHNSFLNYALRDEGDKTLSINFDKVILRSLELPPSLNRH